MTGALLARSGYTTHARTLSEGPVGIMTYSPWRGDFASRPATVAAPAGSAGTSVVRAAVEGGDVSCAAWESASGARCEQPPRKNAVPRSVDARRMRRVG